LEGYESAPNIDQDHGELLKVLQQLGQLYMNIQRFGEAQKLLERARDGYERNPKFGPHHKKTLLTIRLLAWVYMMTQKFGEAETLGSQVLYVCEQEFGPEHLITLNTVSVLGSVYLMQGKLEVAERYYLHGHRGMVNAFGDDHGETISARCNLALTYRAQKRWTDAELILEGLAERQKHVYGVGHPHVYKTLVVQGDVYHMQGNLGKAEEKVREALACAKQMHDEQQRVKTIKKAEWWINHIQQMRASSGVCSCMTKAKKLDS